MSRARLRGCRYRRVFPDIYLPADAPDDLATRSRAAYLLVRDQGGVLAGYSAASLLSADCAPTGQRPKCWFPVMHGRIQGCGSTRCGARGGPQLRRRCRVTTALRTAWDLARWLPLAEAVVAVDSMARRGGFVPSRLLERRPGARRARLSATGRGQCGSLTRGRITAGDAAAGRPGPSRPAQPRRPTRDPRRVRFVLDPEPTWHIRCPAGDRVRRRGHFDTDRLDRDRFRDIELAGHGWETVAARLRGCTWPTPASRDPHRRPTRAPRTSAISGHRHRQEGSFRTLETALLSMSAKLPASQPASHPGQPGQPRPSPSPGPGQPGQPGPARPASQALSSSGRGVGVAAVDPPALVTRRGSSPVRRCAPPRGAPGSGRRATHR